MVAKILLPFLSYKKKRESSFIRISKRDPEIIFFKFAWFNLRLRFQENMRSDLLRNIKETKYFWNYTDVLQSVWNEERTFAPTIIITHVLEYNRTVYISHYPPLVLLQNFDFVSLSSNCRFQALVTHGDIPSIIVTRRYLKDGEGRLRWHYDFVPLTSRYGPITVFG